MSKSPPVNGVSSPTHHRQYSLDDPPSDLPNHHDNDDNMSQSKSSHSNGYKLHDVYNGAQNTFVDPETDTYSLTPSKYVQASPLIPHHTDSLTYNTVDDDSSTVTPAHGGGKSPKTPAHKKRNQTTLFSSFQNLVKPFIGAGILALPHAFAQGGVLASTVMMLVLAVTVNYCIKKLLVCADLIVYNVSTYGTPIHSNNKLTVPRQTQAYHRFDTPQGGQTDQYLDTQDDGAADTDGADADETDQSEHRLHINTNITTINVQQQHRRLTSLTSTSTPTYRQIGYYAFGHVGSVMVDICLCTSQLGFCIAYVSFISENMSSMTSSVLSRRVWCALLLPIFSLLCQIKSMKTLAPTSVFGNITYAVSIAIIFYDGFSHTAQWVSADTVSYVSFRGLPYFFGTACFALEGAGLVLPVKAAMTNKNQFNTLLSAGLTTVTVCYIVFSVLCYIFFGQQVSSVITANLEPGSLTHTVKLSLSLSLLFSYAIQMYPITQMFDQLMDKFIFKYGATTSGSSKQQQYEALQTPTNAADGNTVDESAEHPSLTTAADTPTIAGQPLNTRRLSQITMRIFIVAITVILAIIFPDFGVIVSLIGCLSNSAIAFILPMLFYCKLVIYDSERVALKDVVQAWIVPCVIICIGIAASVAGLTVTIQSIV